MRRVPAVISVNPNALLWPYFIVGVDLPVAIAFISNTISPTTHLHSRQLDRQRQRAATADNIAAHQALFRLGILSDLFTDTMAIFLTLALYRLCKAVDQGLAVVMVILGSSACIATACW